MQTLDVIFTHRSIRDFKDEYLDDDTLQELYRASIASSTSTGTQACSIIHVTDQELKDKISLVCNQDFIAKAPHLFIFVVDSYRNKCIAEEAGIDEHFANSMDIFFQGFSDACIMAQTMALAAQDKNLGICLLGSILNDPGKICEILDLPECVFPAIGMVLGKPDDKVIYQKPRLENKIRVFENTYKRFDEYLLEIVDYNNQIVEYFAKRGEIAEEGKLPNDFTKMVVKRVRKDAPLRRQILGFIRNQGFNLELD